MRLAVFVATLCLSTGGCGGEGQKQDHKPVKAAPTPKPAAVLEGSVHLADGLALPAYPPAAMEKKVLDQLDTARRPEGCSPPKLEDRQPVRLSDEGLLSGVMVAVSGFARQPAHVPVVHDVVIDDCRLVPSLIVAMKGDRLRVRNDANYPFMPGLGLEPMARTIAKGQSYEVTLDTPGSLPLLCGFTAPCGRTDVVVMLHSRYATTDSSGHFRFPDFPAGEPVTVSAWHPLFQETKLTIQVEAGETQHVEIVLTPVPGFEPTSASASTGPAKAAPRR